ncbi:MAG: FAD:protein FMN transferase [Chloroflexota bacterium]|nr:FAD:protein FMN transferase [Chloroflexota bacterium]
MPPETIEVTDSFRAMNTDIELILYPKLASQPNPKKSGATSSSRTILERKTAVTIGKIKELFAQTEACLSRFQPQSELSKLNQQGYLTGASPLLYQSVSEALKMAELTNGIFDPTLLKALEAAGYDRSFELLGQGQVVLAAGFTMPSFHRYRKILLDPAKQAITLPPDTKIDLGGIGKGMTVDRAARLLKQEGITTFMMSGGGDMYLSGEQPGITPPGWTVAVINPFTQEGEITDLEGLSNRGVATSSISKRRWSSGQQGRLAVRHHLIDPRTGQPVENEVVCVTAIAPSTQLADVLAKTALILGPVEGRQFIEKQPGCAALFITSNGTQIRTIGI